MSRKSRSQRPTRPAPASTDTPPAGQAEASADDKAGADDNGSADEKGGEAAPPATMRDAMRAALDARAARQGRTPGSGPRGGSDGPAARGGGAKGFRALPRRSAG